MSATMLTTEYPVLVVEATSEVLWDADGPTEYGIEVYTAGDCWALAWHLSTMTGGTLTTLGKWPGWEHVVVRIGPDAYLDAHGVHAAATLRAYWHLGPRGIVAMDSADTASLEAYTEALRADFVYLAGHDEAEAFARRLVNTHLSPTRGHHLEGELTWH